MAQLPIPESLGRTLYSTYFGLTKDFFVWNSSLGAPLEQLQNQLKESGIQRFVVKPDHLIGKRGKQNLLGLDLDSEGVIRFLKENNGRDVNGIKLNRFLICPFLPHNEEYYVSFSTQAETDDIIISFEGGVDIEENWQKTRTFKIPITQTVPELDLPDVLREYVTKLLQYFREYGFAFLEINPFVYIDGTYIPLDFKGRLDTSALFNLQKELDIYSLLENYTDTNYPEESQVRRLDSLTDASLKLKIINPNGRVWPLVAGGGASIIYFDSLVDKGLGAEIAFYGEYSGNPPFELTYEYAKIIIELLLKSSAQGKVLLIAGANANFTDIAQTFRGIKKALEEHATAINEQKVQILVRRGGPFVDEAFALLRAMADEHGFHLQLEGVSHPLPHVLNYIA